MTELFSNTEDCYELAKILNKTLGKKILFYGGSFIPVIMGEYNSLSSGYYNFYKEFKEDYVIFYYKYLKNGFLRIGIGNGIYNDSMGHRLAALSDFYEVLKKEFGNPDVFYTTKDDFEKHLNFQWSFDNREIDINNFKKDTVFDDASIDQFIIIKKGDNSALRQIMDNSLGLPIELLNMVEDNIEDYIKYKKGTKDKEIEYNNSIESIRRRVKKLTRKG